MAAAIADPKTPAAAGAGPAVAAAFKFLSQFPPVEPYATGWLKVDDTHTLFYQRVGKKGGKPVLFVHGGPGSGCSGSAARWFDPNVWDAVLFDQRGAGQSKFGPQQPPAAAAAAAKTADAKDAKADAAAAAPVDDAAALAASNTRTTMILKDNTTWHLVNDIERLRAHLGIAQWVLFGGSWGSTLSLAYAQTHPTRVKALVVRGIFLCREAEQKWFYQPQGAAQCFPDAYEKFLAPIPTVEHHDLLTAYSRRLFDPLTPLKDKYALARAWSAWETQVSFFNATSDQLAAHDSDADCLRFALIEAHYFAHGGFLKSDEQLLDGADILKAKQIPGTIIHGRYDMCCPLRNAWQLHKRWGSELSSLVIIPDAGHSSGAPDAYGDALLRALEKYKHL